MLISFINHQRQRCLMIEGPSTSQREEEEGCDRDEGFGKNINIWDAPWKMLLDSFCFGHSVSWQHGCRWKKGAVESRVTLNCHYHHYWMYRSHPEYGLKQCGVCSPVETKNLCQNQIGSIKKINPRPPQKNPTKTSLLSSTNSWALLYSWPP